MALFSVPFLLFLTTLILVYYLVPAKMQWMVLLLFSMLFYYLAAGVKSGIFITITILAVFFCARFMDQINAEEKKRLALRPEGKALPLAEKRKIRQESAKKKKKYLAIGLLIPFLLLGILKYSSFVLQNINIFRGLLGQEPFPELHLLLPLGISFYTFQVTGYLIDVYRGREKADQNLFQFALFSSFFPQIIQGPISRHEQLASQLYASHDFDAVRFREGILRLLWGYFKKVVIADRAAIIANQVIQSQDSNAYTGLTIFLGFVFYGIQLYGDFSGGLDMVIGVSDMLGIRLKENFRQPYFSRTISEFWRRWHMSLGEWMLTYVFYPIALSKPFANMGKKLRKSGHSYYGKVLPATIASFLVFLLVGVWHGAAWKFIAFGFYHAVLTSADTLFEREAAKARTLLRIDGESLSWRLFQILRTLFLITIGRYFDCTGGFQNAIDLLVRTFTHFNPEILIDGSLLEMGVDEHGFFLLALSCILLFLVDLANERGHYLRKTFARQGIIFRWILYFATVFFILRFGIYGTGIQSSAFLYQGF